MVEPDPGLDAKAKRLPSADVRNTVESIERFPAVMTESRGRAPGKGVCDHNGWAWGWIS